MASRLADKAIDEHDWHSQEYVDEWIARDDIRLPLLRQMLSVAPFPRKAEISVLDVGAGYGVLSEEIEGLSARSSDPSGLFRAHGLAASFLTTISLVSCPAGWLLIRDGFSKRDLKKSSVLGSSMPGWPVLEAGFRMCSRIYVIQPGVPGSEDPSTLRCRDWRSTTSGSNRS
jgi:hypothetical protein